MVSVRIPEALPKCKLIRTLVDKANTRKDTDFFFVGHLDQFRQRVSGEVRQVNVLFPEYTPHDEDYHLKNLFHVADEVLGINQLEAMNSVELFVLACALYGHDWGMAVSEAEKQYIVTGRPPEGAREEDLWTLRDERERFTEFARKEGLALIDGGCEDIDIILWREYVRQTHAIRSGERVRRYFEQIDRGVAEGVARVCESHCLNFEVLMDPHFYPTESPILREEVNLRAVAVYLRLVDLLDLGSDRTPYIIWKFVAPRDPRAKMEWAKHRALQPVTCSEHQAWRIVQVNGITDDHEIYAALQDLRIYCENQVRGCNDLLVQMHDPRHKLNLYHINWQVEAQGFAPISIQFEFDRERMFEMLSEEIYRGDSHVFLRELLQNSIDAIRMRHAIIKSRGFEPGDIGIIQVTVEHHDGGNAIITWQDDGIGMDEFTVRNYLAVAGKSYYHSDDFKREGIKMDPISRFGIGIFTCFMVSDHIEIDTFKDPNSPSPADPLKIVIPAINRQFRIETRARDRTEVGTTFKIFVDGRKIAALHDNNPTATLDVTAYLSVMAGFVEFPIVITEGNNKTVIVHPHQNADTVRQRFGEQYRVKQLDLSYPWAEAVSPQDVSTALELFRDETYGLCNDLGLEDYEGVLSYPVPIDNTTDFNEGLPGTTTTVLTHKEDELVGRSVHWKRSWHGLLSCERELLSQGEVKFSSNAIYRDGILLPQATFRFPPTTKIGYVESAQATRLVVNLPKSQTPHIDLARTEVLGPSEGWVEPIFRAHLHRLSSIYFKDLAKLSPAERLYQLARLVVFHNVSVNRLWEVFPKDYWPIPLFGLGGQLNILTWPEVANNVIYLTPQPLTTKLASIMDNLLNEAQPKTVLSNWSGEPCVVDFATWSHTSVSISAILEFARWPLGMSHHFVSIRFLSPPWDGNPPLLQEVWFPIELPPEPTDKEIEEVLIKASQSPPTMNKIERVLLHRKMREFLGGHWDHPKIADFPLPFDKSFAYEAEVLNLNHPIVQALIRLAAEVILLKVRKQASMPQIEDLEYLLRRVFRGLPSHLGSTYKEWAGHMNDLWRLTSKMQLIDLSEFEELVPSEEEFVPGARTFLDIRVRDNWNKPFGQPIT